MDFSVPSYRGSSNFESTRRTQQPRRFRQLPDVKRSRECPCAIRLYGLRETDDALSKLRVAAAVLGVPPAILPDMKAFAPAQNDVVGGPVVCGEGGGEGPSNPLDIPLPAPLTNTAPTVPSPAVVVTAWADTTLLELALPALKAVRESVDAMALQRKEQENPDQGYPHEKASGMGAKEIDFRVGSANFMNAGYTQTHRKQGSNDVSPHYRVELCSSVINSEGRATLAPLGKVEFRQVLDNHPTLFFPVRVVEGVHHGTTLTEAGYHLGDPVFFACSRQD